MNAVLLPAEPESDAWVVAQTFMETVAVLELWQRFGKTIL
jgi:hypothetical protein